jgi:hypothetical protein
MAGTCTYVPEKIPARKARWVNKMAEDEDTPSAFCCPIGLDTMVDPVFLIAVWPSPMLCVL